MAKQVTPAAPVTRRKSRRPPQYPVSASCFDERGACTRCPHVKGSHSELWSRHRMRVCPTCDRIVLPTFCFRCRAHCAGTESCVGCEPDHAAPDPPLPRLDPAPLVENPVSIIAA